MPKIIAYGLEVHTTEKALFFLWENFINLDQAIIRFNAVWWLGSAARESFKQ